jgi:hypothetical protein
MMQQNAFSPDSVHLTRSVVDCCVAIDGRLLKFCDAGSGERPELRGTSFRLYSQRWYRTSVLLQGTSFKPDPSHG